jgi:hypothetical protein
LGSFVAKTKKARSEVELPLEIYPKTVKKLENP